MAQSYRNITTELASQLRLVMADVDGTLTPGGDFIDQLVLESILRLEQQDIMVGLVSGRTMPMLESLAGRLSTSGPLIAENGGVAKLKADSQLLDLGYSRRPAIKALERLRLRFPGSIKEREDNRERLVDVVFWPQGIPTEELRSNLRNVQLLDSGYILHLMQQGISKGRTLMRLLGQIGDGGLTPMEILVVGDSTTDLSLFQLFPHSVLIANPRLPTADRESLRQAAEYFSDGEYGDGFAEVALHIVNARERGG
jgi:hydroxymethylpyrimidine pyrophosphatase-like HAD family hydrolase